MRAVGTVEGREAAASENTVVIVLGAGGPLGGRGEGGYSLSKLYSSSNRMSSSSSIAVAD